MLKQNGNYSLIFQRTLEANKGILDVKHSKKF